MILDLRSVADHSPPLIPWKTIEQVYMYQYLRVHFDHEQFGTSHVTFACYSISQLLHFLCRLQLNGINAKIMLLFYKTVIESILRYGIVVWQLKS